MARSRLRKSVFPGAGRPVGSEINKLSVRFRYRLQEAGALLLASVGLYLLLSLTSYYANDPSWANTQPQQNIQNLGGLVGAWVAYALYFLFGRAAFLLPLVMFTISMRTFLHRDNRLIVHLTQGVGYLLALLALCGLIAMHFSPGAMPASAGGRLGELIAQGFISVFGPVGATLLMLSLLIGSIHLVTTLSWLKIMDTTGAALMYAGGLAIRFVRALKEKRASTALQSLREMSIAKRKRKISQRKKKIPRIEPKVSPIRTSGRAQKEKQPALFTGGESTLPPLDNLDRSETGTKGLSEQSLQAMARQLEIKLSDFNVDAEVVGARSGPVITRFELTPSPGTKASRITALEKDLARALSVPSVRVVEVIAGKSTMGLEVPNEIREMVLLHEILNSEAYDKAGSPLTLALGKDISGMPVLTDLERMPHLLVAGTTGSGKSVAVHSMLMSILFKASPRDVRLILIDPKMLELNAYEDIPHLLTPVITDMNQAVTVLKWVVAEMERRYRLMSSLAVRNIGGYNRKIEQAAQAGKPLTDPSRSQSGLQTEPEEAPPLESMPYIIVVVDEFADMMMIVGKRVEELIARLAQKARAAGIHLILATQRPSVDVITGLIKANIAARIAFQVSSKVDSRTILDQNGAEQLLGQGDMLYLSPGTAAVERVHGAFVSESEVRKVTDFLRKQSEPGYIDMEEDSEAGGYGSDGDEADPLYDDVVAMAVETREISTSSIQRRFRVGYNRAARMMEQMEAAGIVGPVQANGRREVVAPPSA